MKEVKDLPAWAQRLRRVLDVDESQLDALRTQLDSLEDENWFTAAAEGTKEPSAAQYAVLSVATGVPLTVLAGTVEPEQSLSYALRAGVLETEGDVLTLLPHAQQVLTVLSLLLSWFRDERSTRSKAVDLAKRARSGHQSPAFAGLRTAEKLRDLFDLGDQPIEDLPGFIESLGVPVLHDELSSNLHGITVHDRSSQHSDALVLINNNDWWGRQRFTLAHELCHVIYDDGALTVNRHGTSDSPDPVEQRANAFARHFLAPAAAVRDFWAEASGDTGRRLAEFMLRFGMSREASIITITSAVNLSKAAFPPTPVAQLMMDAGVETTWEQMCDAHRDPKCSQWMLSMALDAYANGLVTPDVVASVLGREDVAAVKEELHQQGWRDAV